jgi:Homeodomain-like domain
MLTLMRTAVGIAGAAADDPGTGLRAVAALRDLADRLETLQVGNARQLGWSWPEIATMLGVTQHTVHRKHHKRGKDRRDGRCGQRSRRR